MGAMAVHYNPTSLMVIAGMIGLGLAAIIGCIWSWWHRVQSAAVAATWPTADGEIRSVEVVHIPDNDGPDLYEPHIHYRYRAMSGIRQGNRLRVGATTQYTERLAAELAIRPYRPGDRVKVFYDPARPDRSVLEPVPSPTGIRQWLIMGIFLILAGSYCFISITWPSPFGGDCPKDRPCTDMPD
jgi:hypothetical protein